MESALYSKQSYFFQRKLQNSLDYVILETLRKTIKKRIYLYQNRSKSEAKRELE